MMLTGNSAEFECRWLGWRGDEAGAADLSALRMQIGRSGFLGLQSAEFLAGDDEIDGVDGNAGGNDRV